MNDYLTPPPVHPCFECGYVDCECDVSIGDHTTTVDMWKAKLAAAKARIVELGRQIEGHFREHHEVTQALGKALRYPTEGPEVGGDHTTVCVGEHAPGTLAQEAAKRIAELEAALRDLIQLPVGRHQLEHLDKGIGTRTHHAAWLRAREALDAK